LYNPTLNISFPIALWPKVGQGLLVIEVSRSHTMTHHSRQESSVRVISSLYGTSTSHHTTLTTNKRPSPRWNSNPPSQ